MKDYLEFPVSAEDMSTLAEEAQCDERYAMAAELRATIIYRDLTAQLADLTTKVLEARLAERRAKENYLFCKEKADRLTSKAQEAQLAEKRASFDELREQAKKISSIPG